MVEREAISEGRQTKRERRAINLVPRSRLRFEPLRPCHLAQHIDERVSFRREFDIPQVFGLADERHRLESCLAVN